MSSRFVAGIEIKAFDQFSRTMDKFARKMNVVSKSTKKAQENFNNFNNSTMTITASLKRMGIVASATMAGIAAFSVKSGSAFEKASASFEALTGLGGDELERVSSAALSASKKYGRSAAEIMDGTRALASAKSELMDPKAVDSLNKIMGSVLTLSEIADISVTQATESLVTALNTFGQKAKKPAEMADWTAKALDKMAFAAKIGKMPVQQLTVAFARAAGAMHGAGLTFEEALGATQIGALTGLNPSMIGRQLKNIAIKMKQANKTMGDEGFSFTEIMSKLAGKKLGITELTKAIGAENILVLKSLIDYNTTGKKFAEAIKNNSANASIEMFAKKTDHLVFHIMRLWRTIEEKLIRVYKDILGPILRKTVNQLIKFVEWSFSGTKSAKAFTLALGALALVLASVLTGLSAMFGIGYIMTFAKVAIPVVSGMIMLFKTLAGGALFLAWGVGTVIGGLYLLSAWLRSNNKRSFFRVMFDDLKLLFGAVKAFFDYWFITLPALVIALGGPLNSLFLMGSALTFIKNKLLLNTLLTKGWTIATVYLKTAWLGVLKPFLIFAAKFALIAAGLLTVLQIVLDIGAAIGLWKPIKLIDEENLITARDWVRENLGFQKLADMWIGVDRSQLEGINKPLDQMTQNNQTQSIVEGQSPNTILNQVINIDSEGNVITEENFDVKKEENNMQLGFGQTNPLY